MVQQQINGATQIRSATITNAQLAAAAGITDGQLAAVYLYANGTRALTGNLQGGGFEAQNFVSPTANTSLTTKAYVDAAVQGLPDKYTARAGTNTETLTISAGNITTIAGTTVDGVTVAVNDYIFIPNAPASTGAAGGAAMTTQPGNGLYQVSAVAANITVGRAPDFSGSINPFGAQVFVAAGPTWGTGGYLVTTPSSSAAFTYGTNNIAFTQFTGVGEITVDSTLVKTGNQLSRAALTSDVTVPSGSNTATIAAAAVTLAKMANLAANSVIGNATGSSATPTAIALAIAATASAIAQRDTNANLTINNLIESVQTIATAAGTTTLTVSSPSLTQFTGSTTQTCVLPNATTLTNGTPYIITNRSSGTVTLNMNGGSLLVTMPGGSQVVATLINNSTAAGVWDAALSSTASGLTAPSAGMVKSNGTVLQAATAGTDYMAPADFVTRETPTGTVNGSNTTFTLANTPIAGTEQVFLNGLLQEPGAGNDYTISGTTITYLTAPLAGDKIRVNYQK
jgi:hypothetical protein